MMYQISKGDCIEFTYVNWEGETAIREVIVEGLLFGSNNYHTDEQFLLEAFDINKKEMRTFAIKDMSDIFVWNSNRKTK